MTSSIPPITAIIVTYNSARTITAALMSLFPTYVDGILDVVVIDNNSSDKTAYIVESSFAWVKLIRSEENLGYGRGCNLGFKYVKSEYVLILNPDVELPSKSIDELLRFMHLNPEAGIVAPAIIENGKHYQAAGLMSTPKTVVGSMLDTGNLYPHKRIIYPGDTPFKTNWVCGAVMLIHSALFKQLHGFDPRFFLYFEETDLCKRVTEKGKEIWAIGTAIATHVGGASAVSSAKEYASGCISQHFYQSRLYYLVKHHGRIVAYSSDLIARMLQNARWLKNQLVKRNKNKSINKINLLFRLPPLVEKRHEV